nr:hypothetical protein B0A51_00315 [Rachicladosporium sp. CCFEE 5018]
MSMGLIDGGPFDNQSVMLYNGYDGRKPVDGWIREAMLDARVTDSAPDARGERRDGLLRTCGVTNVTKCEGPSKGYIARVVQLYPRDAAESSTTQISPAATRRAIKQTREEPAIKPMRVIMEGLTMTLRPAVSQVPVRNGSG